MLNARSHALTFLSTLSDKAFAEFFYEAVRGRTTSDRNDWNGHFILADAERIVADEPWDVDLIAIHDRQQYADWVDDAPICQSGTCTNCSNRVRSWAKQATCPVCSQTVHCT
ncbi:MAG: hypothetical protein C0483_03910 [Pirellula sp.]|nr:hypothetical protein [Pirellula sp.]